MGEATFHDICWKAVLDSLRMDNPFCFSSLEKSVVDEAKRTAEYFDSVEKLNMEADRIAEMLKSATNAIAFTGLYFLLRLLVSFPCGGAIGNWMALWRTFNVRN